MNLVHVEYVTPICKIEALSVVKILTSILPIVCSNLLYFILKHWTEGVGSPFWLVIYTM